MEKVFEIFVAGLVITVSLILIVMALPFIIATAAMLLIVLIVGAVTVFILGLLGVKP